MPAEQDLGPRKQVQCGLPFPPRPLPCSPWGAAKAPSFRRWGAQLTLARLRRHTHAQDLEKIRDLHAENQLLGGLVQDLQVRQARPRA